MNIASLTHWGIPIISLIVFILTFFIFLRETQEIFSSLTAAIFSSILVLVALIVISWMCQVFTK